ncbi:arginine/agmatine antiporter [Novosphingobium sp. TCA1]|uniref:arginine/agmatine antiporter n=1 Tax=Novosphingobium sp. TCA1 TaxID=2682474 RepID=UPI00130C9A7F|nr:arginine/agmatine antiporter [Novosphingobium sp. TCA1]GFE72905.1 arginine/agmatine antiporter [Novosphingobium sp. TCA1]
MATAAAAADDSGKIGLVPATLMVAGNMMGSGVFMLPANLSAIGSIALIGWLLTVVGAVALALVFAKLSAIDPAAGGPYAYARKAYGDYMGYQTNLIYWLANVVGNVALAVAGLGYLSHFFPALKVPIVMAFGSIAIIWFFAYANILGPKVVGRLQSFTTVFALVPIFGMALFGWFWFKPEIFSSAWNVSGQSSPNAVMATLTFTLWAFIGVESASVSAGVVANPSRNVPIATVGGVVLASVAYVLSSSVIMGMIPNKELIASSAPFADAARLALGDFAGSTVALCAAVGCLGSLAGWTLLVGQSAKAAADDGLFPGIFAKVNKRGVPSLGLVIVAVIMSVQVLATMSPTASQQFGKIASIAVIMTLLPYIYSCIAVKVLGYGKMPHGQYTFFVAAGLAGAIYCMIALVGSDGEQTRWSLIFVIATIVFYSASITRKRDLEEKHIHPGGKAPVWVRYLALGVTIVALVVMFWLSVGRHSDLDLRSREQAPAEAGETAQQMAPSGAD